MSSNDNSQSRPHSYDHNDNDKSHDSQSFSFSEDEEVAPRGFDQPLYGHDDHYHLRPSAFDIEDGVTLSNIISNTKTIKHY